MTTWPLGYETVTVVGSFGWPAVPELINRATIDLARAMFNSTAPNLSDYGAAQTWEMTARLPDTVYRAIQIFAAPESVAAV